LTAGALVVTNGTGKGKYGLRGPNGRTTTTIRLHMWSSVMGGRTTVCPLG
jgi:hypothetical protein